MRKKIVAGNWKMNLTLEEGKQLVEGILAGLPELNEQHQVVFAPPFTHLHTVAEIIKNQAHVSTAAQNIASEASGAYTGEVSADMIISTGAGYTLIGHSERRQHFNENTEVLIKKINLALEKKLQIIFCCGEPLEIRDANTQNDYVAQQIATALFHLDENQLKQITIAYEPIWAIGTGRTATASQAQDMHQHIRNTIENKYGATTAQNLTILYGGSCNDKNAAELFAGADVDGGLIGGASLKAVSFLPIVRALIAS